MVQISAAFDANPNATPTERIAYAMGILTDAGIPEMVPAIANFARAVDTKLKGESVMKAFYLGNYGPLLTMLQMSDPTIESVEVDRNHQEVPVYALKNKGTERHPVPWHILRLFGVVQSMGKEWMQPGGTMSPRPGGKPSPATDMSVNENTVGDAIAVLGAAGVNIGNLIAKESSGKDKGKVTPQAEYLRQALQGKLTRLVGQYRAQGRNPFDPEVWRHIVMTAAAELNMRRRDGGRLAPQQPTQPGGQPGGRRYGRRRVRRQRGQLSGGLQPGPEGHGQRRLRRSVRRGR